MKSHTKRLPVILLVLLFFPIVSLSQDKEAMPSNKVLTDAAREIISAAGTCTLITLDENGLPMARVMDPFPPESDFTIWFGTNPRSRKVSQIKNNPVVTLLYQDTDGSGYVVIHGNALLSDDRNEKEKHWKEEWAAFYQDKTKDYLLIEVSAEWMEVLSFSRGIVSDPETWKAPVVKFSQEK